MTNENSATPEYVSITKIEKTLKTEKLKNVLPLKFSFLKNHTFHRNFGKKKLKKSFALETFI